MHDSHRINYSDPHLLFQGWRQKRMFYQSLVYLSAQIDSDVCQIFFKFCPLYKVIMTVYVIEFGCLVGLLNK